MSVVFSNGAFARNPENMRPMGGPGLSFRMCQRPEGGPEGVRPVRAE